MDEKLKTKRKGVSYAKWGYIFILPFFVAYIIFTLTPQIMTFYNSFFENYRSGLKQIGPNFVGLQNYVSLFSPDKTGTVGMLKYFGNTMILWLMGAVPQIVVALLLAVFFTSYRLNIKGQQFFKTVIYMPNLIMAAAFSMLFFTLFSTVGPVNQVLLAHGIVEQSVNFLGIKISVRLLISLMNFLMWFGNTTILLMAGIQGIDQNMFEAAEIDGANSLQVFFRVTMPLLAPILVYTIITAMIGGLQMYDHHGDDRRPADVRRPSGADQRQGHARPRQHDHGHVSEQLSGHQQELRHGRRDQRGAVHRLGGAEPVRVQLAVQAV